MGWFIALAFSLAAVVLFNELCKLGSGGSLARRFGWAWRRGFGRWTEPRPPFSSALPDLVSRAPHHHEPIAWDDPDDTPQLWTLSSLADELPPPRAHFSALLDEDLDEATLPRGA